MPTVARRAGRRELVVVSHAPAVVARLVSAGAHEREEGVLVLPRNLSTTGAQQPQENSR